MTRSDINELIAQGITLEPESVLKLIETHISWVIVGQKYVFKIKKPVHYSFLDFSTLEKREFYCHRELSLNKRLAPHLYIDVLPIRKTSTSLAIGGNDGNIIDYAVRMWKLDNHKQMDVLLKENKVRADDIQSLATKIADFHKGTKIIYRKNVLDIQDKFNDLALEKTFLEQELGDGSDLLIAEAINASDTFLNRHTKMLQSRLQMGYFRDCHGDLHSRNIFLLPEPVIFDCIEFNDDYREIDVLNEAAFLCMDLDACDREDLSDLFLQAYNRLFTVIKTNEDKMLFIYYKCYRANVRAKVNSLRSKSTTEITQRKQSLSEAGRYLQLMNKYMRLLLS